MMTLAALAAIPAVIGILLCLASWIAVARFAARKSCAPKARPPVTILKPLYGAEPLLEETLASAFAQAYPNFQIVFGLHDQNDPALVIVRRLQDRYPDINVAVIVDPTLRGPNRKVSNLINMLPSALHEILVISDSDLHLPPDYLDQLVAKLEAPGVGLVTAAYIGLPPIELGWRAKLAATQITHNFLPGVLLSRLLGREDCLGSTTMLRRDTLERTGGLEALNALLAEDNVLGQRVRQLGLSVALADMLVAATVPEGSFGALWQHEMRWMRTIRLSAPVALATSMLQYPLFWSTLSVVLSGAAVFSLIMFGCAWGARTLSVMRMNAALSGKVPQLAPGTNAWLLPLRDILSVMEIVASYWVEDVVWRGHRFNAIAKGPLAAQAGGAIG